MERRPRAAGDCTGRSWRVALVLALALLAGCDGEPSPGRVVPDPPPVPEPPGRSGLAPQGLEIWPGGSRAGPVAVTPAARARFAPGAGGRRGDTLAGADFADWVVASDPRRQYVLEAFVSGERRLDALVNPHVPRRQVDRALRVILGAMRRAFPGRPVELVAVGPSGDDLARLAWDAEGGGPVATWR